MVRQNQSSERKISSIITNGMDVARQIQSTGRKISSAITNGNLCTTCLDEIVLPKLSFPVEELPLCENVYFNVYIFKVKECLELHLYQCRRQDDLI